MAGPQPWGVELTTEEREGLEQLVRAHGTPQQVALRARIVLGAAEGLNNTQLARRLEIMAKTARHWRAQWRHWRAVPLEEVSVAERLVDAPRTGAPARITPEQICQIIALACEVPTDADRPISQWSQRELADEIMTRGLVEHISPRHAGRLLQRSRSEAPPDPLLAHPVAHRTGSGAGGEDHGRVYGLPGGPDSSRPGGAHPEHR
jgi:putative transposase